MCLWHFDPFYSISLLHLKYVTFLWAQVLYILSSSFWDKTCWQTRPVLCVFVWCTSCKKHMAVIDVLMALMICGQVGWWVWHYNASVHPYVNRGHQLSIVTYSKHCRVSSTNFLIIRSAQGSCSISTWTLFHVSFPSVQESFKALNVSYYVYELMCMLQGSFTFNFLVSKQGFGGYELFTWRGVVTHLEFLISIG
jgi:hypothetical protein